MPSYAVFGAGMMGRVVAQDLLVSEADANVALFDRSDELLADAKDGIADSRLATNAVDAKDSEAVARAMFGHDVAIAALPHGLSLGLVVSAIASGTSLVDLVGDAPDERRALDAEARRAGALIVPGCGVAPGISNFCVGRSIELVDETQKAVIYVGGIPRKPEPPLWYQTVFLLESVLAVYRRQATIRRDGRWVEVEPLTEVEELAFPEPIGKLEAFFTDGLGSLPMTLGERVENDLYEKTLRYPGHVSGILFLEKCGLLSPAPVDVAGASVAPVAVLQKVLEDKLRLGPEGDILVMRIVVEGRSAGRSVAHEFELIDYFDAEAGHTAMARTTGFTAACAARRIASGAIEGGGVRFPEEIFLGEQFDSIVAELGSKGVRIEHREREMPLEA